jgi:PAS domain S-box-containing protein
VDWQLLDLFKRVDAVAPYQGSYEPALVVISVLIAIMAAFVALSISARMVAASSWHSRWAWASAGAFSMGGGIWAMHFIGMLAFSLPCGISYNPLLTLLSMIPGILASGVALHVISRTTEPSLTRLLIGAVLMGAGIGAMHYSGMAAVRSEALLRYEAALVGVSVVVAVVLAFISLEVRFQLRRYRCSETVATIAAASIMGFAVSGMHYTAMQASIFFPVASLQSPGLELPTTLMALMITVIFVLITAIAIVASFAGRQSELAAGLKAEMGRRQALEQEAQDGRARLQAIFDAVVDAIVTIDKRGHIQQWSSGAQRIFGYTAEEMVGADLTLLMPQPHRGRHAGYVASFLRTRAAKIIGTGREMTAVRKDGTEFPIELSVSEVRNGEEVFFTGIMRDITERKRAEAELVRAREQAEAANAAKSQFLATMSHEIRTPMNGVLGMANLLSSTLLNDRQRRLVDNVTRSGQALLGIINDILDFAKIEAGKLELSAVPFDPREAVAELSDLFSERCANKGLEFVYFVAEEVPARLVGDAVRLRQILVNLVGNAVKFTEHGEIVVQVTIASDAPETIALRFVVEDSGIGIAPEQCARVFESFYQVDGSLTRVQGGSGLGLSITRQLVELMGGTIGVESELGRGSRFIFTAQFGPTPYTAEPARTLRHLARPLRVLLADANRASAEIIALYLANWKIDAAVVPTTARGEEVWREAAAAGRPFDVAILDVKGLGSPAVELARAIRAGQDGPTGALILLVGIDSYMMDTSLEALGASAILPKPVRPSELFNTLVEIAAEGGQGNPKHQFLRHKSPEATPQFAARILVAEDNPVNQEVAAGILETMGCEIVSALNGEIAVERFAGDRFDLILMDCEMPVMDGIAATRRIREREAASGTARRTPIIALTAHALNEVRDKCLAAGMDDFLIKPYDDDQMAQTLLRWLGATRDAAASEPRPATPPPAASAAIDAGVIAGLRALDRKGGPSRLVRAVSRFLEVAPALAASVKEAAGNGDGEALWRAAHSLKSSAAALGALALSKRSAEIEARARDTGLAAALPLVPGLDDDLQAATAGLEALLGEIHVPA